EKAGIPNRSRLFSLDRERSVGLFRHGARPAVERTLLAGDGARFNDLAVDARALGGRPLVVRRGTIDDVESKARPISFGPFEIVRKAPVIITADIGAVLDRIRDLLKNSDDILCAADAILGGNARLGHHEREVRVALREIA